MSFADLGLLDRLLSNLGELGYADATPIQREAIPVVLEGRDVLATAETGTGKTAAFALPMLQQLAGKPVGRGSAMGLVLVPTRELAVQVSKAFERYGRSLESRPRVVAVYGGAGIEPQVEAMRRGAGIVVATPGRLLDLAERGEVDFDSIELLVLDEADRLLALGFADELQEILSRVPQKCQNLLFSATFPQGVMAMAESLLTDPVKLGMDRTPIPEMRIQQRFIEVEKDRRTALLRALLAREGWERALVFVGSKRRADNVSAKLGKYGIQSLSLHGDLNQKQRMHALDRFKKGRIQILIATDVAARGLDIVGLDCVVNYDLPRAPADYAHRIGRTGRAGTKGVAVSFVTEESDAQMNLIEKRLKLQVERERVEGFEPERWEPQAPAKGKAPVKGKRKSKKDKLREAAAREEGESQSPWKLSSPAERKDRPDPEDPWGRARS